MLIDECYTRARCVVAGWLLCRKVVWLWERWIETWCNTCNISSLLFLFVMAVTCVYFYASNFMCLINESYPNCRGRTACTNRLHCNSHFRNLSEARKFIYYYSLFIYLLLLLLFSCRVVITALGLPSPIFRPTFDSIYWRIYAIRWKSSLRSGASSMRPGWAREVAGVAAAAEGAGILTRVNDCGFFFFFSFFFWFPFLIHSFIYIYIFLFPLERIISQITFEMAGASGRWFKRCHLFIFKRQNGNRRAETSE